MPKSSQQRLLDFINDPDNKIVQSLQIRNTKVIAKVLPYDYRSMSQKDTDPDDHYTYFNVKIEANREKPSKEKLLYLDFDIQNDFLLLRGHDSIPAVICQRIVNGKADSYEYLLAFDNEHSKEDFTLFYKDKSFGIGTIAFVYKQEDLLKIPALKTLVSNEAYH